MEKDPIAAQRKLTPETMHDVWAVLSQPEGMDTHSGWQWFRLTDGTLILGVCPCGDTYERMSQREGMV